MPTHTINKNIIETAGIIAKIITTNANNPNRVPIRANK